MAVDNYEIFMATFPTEDGAEQAVDTLEEMAKRDTIEIIDAAVLTRTEDGEVKVEQKSLPSVKSGAKWGAIVGGVLGVVFPPSIIGTALVGAGVAAGTAKLAKMAMENDELKEAAESLEPGTSAFIAVVDNKWVRKMSEAMRGYNKLAEHALDAESAARLGVISDEEAGVAAEYGTATSVDPESGARIVAEETTVVDAVTGDVATEATIVGVDPDSGTVAAAHIAAAGNVSDEGSEALGAPGGDDETEDDE